MAENVKKPRFGIVTADEIVDNGQISFGFVIRSGIDPTTYFDFCEGRWGHIIDLVKDGQPSITVNIFKDGDLVFGWGNDDANPEWIGDLIPKMPGCAILMKKEYAEIFKAKCDELGYEYFFNHFNGILTTY